MDIECLIDVINSVLDDKKYYPTHDSPEFQAIMNLRNRLEEEEKTPLNRNPSLVSDSDLNTGHFNN